MACWAKIKPAKVTDICLKIVLYDRVLFTSIAGACISEIGTGFKYILC